MARITNNRILLITVLIIAILGIAAAFVPVIERDYIVIQAPLNNVLPAVQELRYWKNWHPDVPADSSRINISGKQLLAKDLRIEAVTTTPFGILVNQSLNGHQTAYSLVVQASDNAALSKVEIRFGATLLKLLWDEAMNLLPSGPNRTLLALRTYLEDTEKYYGYPIVFETVTDTLVITTMSQAENSAINDSLRFLFSRLRDYTKANQVPVTDSPMAYIQRTEQPIKKLMAALPVTREVSSAQGMEYLRMPEGRMLTIDFKGDYSNIHQAYRAGDRYINDYNLKTVALPYERYYSIADSSHAHVKIFVPVF